LTRDFSGFTIFHDSDRRFCNILDNRAAISFHDGLASCWENEYKSDIFRVRLQVLSSLIPAVLRGQTWLDAGCGTGTIARWLAAERGASVVAVDGSDKMLSHAVPAQGVEYRNADVVRTGLPDQSCDGVVCSSVLEYLPEPEVALKEFHRILKPGGFLLASVPNRALSVRIPLNLIYWLTRPLGARRRFAYLDHSKHSFSAEQFKAVLDRNGFVPERVINFGRLGLPFRIKVSSAGTLLMGMARKTSAPHNPEARPA
jgi:ubiquinone/menaquinone biosynthesis C-methylase UbiE